MTPKSKEELREQIYARFQEALRNMCKSYRDGLSGFDFLPAFEDIMQLFTSSHQQQLEQAVREARLDELTNIANWTWENRTKNAPWIYYEIRDGRIAELQSTKEDKS